MGEPVGLGKRQNGEASFTLAGAGQVVMFTAQTDGVRKQDDEVASSSGGLVS